MDNHHVETIQVVYDELKSEEKTLCEKLAVLKKEMKPLEKYLVEVGVIEKRKRNKPQVDSPQVLSE